MPSKRSMVAVGAPPSAPVAFRFVLDRRGVARTGELSGTAVRRLPTVAVGVIGA